MVVDGSVVLRGFFPDEVGHDEAQAIIRAYVRGEVDLMAPTLLPYEVTNAVLLAVRQHRLTLEKGTEVLAAFEDLGVPTLEVSWQRALLLGHTYGRSAYDGAYLALAEETGSEFVTADRRLYNAVKKHLRWVFWIEDFRPSELG